MTIINMVTAATRFLVIGLGGLLVVVVAVEIFFRYVLGRSLFFADELARYLFVWVAFLASSLALRRGLHVGLELDIHARWRALQLAAHGLVAVFLVVFLVSSIELLPVMWQQNATTLEIRMVWPYLALPVGALLMLVQLVPVVRETLRGRGRARNGAP